MPEQKIFLKDQIMFISFQSMVNGERGHLGQNAQYLVVMVPWPGHGLVTTLHHNMAASHVMILSLSNKCQHAMLAIVQVSYKLLSIWLIRFLRVYDNKCFISRYCIALTATCNLTYNSDLFSLLKSHEQLFSHSSMKYILFTYIPSRCKIQLICEGRKPYPGYKTLASFLTESSTEGIETYDLCQSIFFEIIEYARNFSDKV